MFVGDILKLADVWAVGIIAYIMLLGKFPFNGRNSIDELRDIVKCDILFHETNPKHHNKKKINISPTFKDFIRKIHFFHFIVIFFA